MWHINGIPWYKSSIQLLWSKKTSSGRNQKVAQVGIYPDSGLVHRYHLKLSPRIVQSDWGPHLFPYQPVHFIIRAGFVEDTSLNNKPHLNIFMMSNVSLTQGWIESCVLTRNQRRKWWGKWKQ